MMHQTTWIAVVLTGLAAESSNAQPDVPIYERVLSKENKAKVEGLSKQVSELDEAGKHKEAIELAEQIHKTRSGEQGTEHWETIDARLRVAKLRRIAAMSKDERAEYASLRKLLKNAHDLADSGQHPQSLQLQKQGIVLAEKVWGEVHIETARSHAGLGYSLFNQRRYFEALPHYRKELELNRLLLGNDHPDTIMSCGNVGANLSYSGKAEEAQPFLEEQLASYTRVLGPTHRRTLGCYAQLAYNLASLRRYDEAVEFSRKDLAGHEFLGKKHPQLIEKRSNLGYILQRAGRHKEAESVYREVLRLCRKALDNGHPLTAVSLGRLAFNLFVQERHAAAVPLYREQFALYRVRPGERHPATIQACRNLAMNLFLTRAYAEARKHYETALAMSIKTFGPEHRGTADNYFFLARNLQMQERYSAAQSRFERALAIRWKTLGELHPDTAKSLSALAHNFSIQGKHGDAEPLYRKALSIRTELSRGREHPEIAASYVGLAGNLERRGQHAEAQRLYKEVLRIYVDEYGDKHLRTAEVYSHLADNLVDQGQHAAARTWYEKALAIALTSYHGVATAGAHHNFAWSLGKQGKHSEAQAHYAKALAIRQELLGDEAPLTVSSRHGLAWILKNRGEYDKALEQFSLAAMHFEKSRLRFSESGLERGLSSNSPLPGLAAALARSGQPARAWDHWERSRAPGLLDDLSARAARKLSVADQRREEKLVGQLAQLDALLRASAGKSGGAGDFESTLAKTRQERLRVQAELSEFEKHLSETYGVAEGKTYARKVIQALLPADAALVGWLDFEGTATAADPRGEHWAVVLRAKGEPKWIKLPGSGTGGRWIPEDDQLGKRFAASLRKRENPGPSRDLASRLAAQRLAPLKDALGEKGGLPAVRRLIVVPSSALRDVPVAALTDEYVVSYAPSGTVLAWLRQRRPVVSKKRSLLAVGDPVLQRADAAAPEKLPAPPPHGVLLTAVRPGYNADRSGLRSGDVLLSYGGKKLEGPRDLSAAVAGAANKAKVPAKVWRDGATSEIHVGAGQLSVRLDPRPAPEVLRSNREFASLMSRAHAIRRFDPLPATRFEVEAIAAGIRSEGGRVEKLLGKEASEQRVRELLKDGKLSGFRYLHFATHGITNPTRAFDSALILSQDALPDPVAAMEAGWEITDGRLTAAEILRTWKLDADLVVLSACQTAIGRYTRGEGNLGFAQALLLAGARSVVLSLWKVDDAPTMLLMKRLYENLLGTRTGLSKPMPKAEALQEAQSWLRQLDATTAAKLTAHLPARSRGDVVSGKPVVENRPYAEPFYWGAFVLIGDPD